MKKVFALFVLLFLCRPTFASIEAEGASDWVTAVYRSVNENFAAKVVRTTFKQASGFDIEPTLMLAVIAIESSFNPKAKSRTGAKGLTQVMPRWHKNKIRGRNLYDPAVSIEVGSKIMFDCLTKYKGNKRKALGCYCGYSGQRKRAYVNSVLRHQKRLDDHIKAFLVINDRHPPVIFASR